MSTHFWGITLARIQPSCSLKGGTYRSIQKRSDCSSKNISSEMVRSSYIDGAFGRHFGISSACRVCVCGWPNTPGPHEKQKNTSQFVYPAFALPLALSLSLSLSLSPCLPLPPSLPLSLFPSPSLAPSLCFSHTLSVSLWFLSLSLSLSLSLALSFSMSFVCCFLSLSL